jgi:hypothetical protein
MIQQSFLTSRKAVITGRIPASARPGSAINADVAKKCREIMVKKYPPKGPEPGREMRKRSAIISERASRRAARWTTHFRLGKAATKR